MPILQCRRCQCYDGCDLVQVDIAMKNLEKFNKGELVTLEEVMSGKKPRCEGGEQVEGGVDAGKKSLEKPVTRATKRKIEDEGVTIKKERMNDGRAVRVCIGPEDNVVMEISLLRVACVGKCEKETCGHCYAKKKPTESMKAVRRKKKQMLRKSVVNIY